jgi:NADPH2:quinone reductase
MAKRLIHTGSTLRSRDLAFKAAVAAAVAEHFLPMVAAGTVRTVVDSTFPLRAVAAAHRRLEAAEHIGKVILQVR